MNVASPQDFVPLPRTAVLAFPVELAKPAGFRPEDASTWPQVQGRLEYLEGRLWYMPPCGDDQQDVATSVAVILGTWAESADEFVVGSNEAGMLLGGEVRGAEAAVWRRDQLPRRGSGGFRRVAPLLAVEVGGQDEDEAALREKARWYLRNGVKVVWLVLPAKREVVVELPRKRRRFKVPDRLPPHPDLPGLAPEVARFFRQLR